jgi:hypothetical protein
MDFRAGWRYRIAGSDRWSARLGAGGMYQNTNVVIQAADESLRSEVDNNAFLPFAHAALEIHVVKQVMVAVEVEGMSISGDRLLDSGATVNWAWRKGWSAGIGYAFYDRDIETSELKNVVRYNALGFRVGHVF